MKVRKGQNSISFKHKAHAIAEVKWLSKNGVYKSTLEQADFGKFIVIVHHGRLGEVPQYASFHESGRIHFHPPAPCAGEIRVRYTTLHEI